MKFTRHSSNFGLVGGVCSKEFYRLLHDFGFDKNRFYSWRVALGKIIILKKKSFVRLEVMYVFMPGLGSFMNLFRLNAAISRTTISVLLYFYLIRIWSV